MTVTERGGRRKDSVENKSHTKKDTGLVVRNGRRAARGDGHRMKGFFFRPAPGDESSDAKKQQRFITSLL